ncbi:unnamed protein product [Rotaria socialis]|uniref:Receptor protein-tyrosine kinase n=2 Tax=Rotaria socialis TaxID=392032 RepID=A0A817TJ45_9BILA|nr:unnamed protein product [Rotaria socialis]
MNIFGFRRLLFLFIGLVPFGDLSPVNNDNNNQRQAQVANTIVNQPTPVILSTRPSNLLASTSMQWIKTLKNITENGGSTVILECQVQSAHTVSFNWYRYNNPLDKRRFSIDQSAFRSSINLKNLKESEAGFYTCEVSNGFQTLASTGFVRVKNPVDIDDTDSNDELLPSIDFQPEIVINSDEQTNKLKCEQYTGSICRPIISSQYISTTNQNEIEKNLMENLNFVTNNELLSKECGQLLLQMICLFAYPICDNDRFSVRSICRHSCEYFQNHACSNLFNDKLPQMYSNLQLIQKIPTCDNLPPTSDDSTCIIINQTVSSRPKSKNSSSSNSRSTTRHPETSTSHILTILCVITAPVAVCLIMVIICWCYHRKNNNNSHLSTCSSTSTPIKKSTHLINTVTSSPFRPSITTNINKPNPRYIPSSSSSSNTYFTNTHLRQTLLKSEIKHPNFQNPLSESSLAEIPFTNIRILQELGEGDFGRIYKGEFVDSSQKCIIKTLQTEFASPQNREEYSREIEIFRHIRHSNISCLLGICMQPQNALSLMIYERLNDGDLHEYLLQRSTAISLYQQRDLTDFLYISIQIISGMVYLAEKNFVHNDLSAKNILISEHMDIKISNIARYRPKYDADYYKIANRSLPVRWMAIESLLSGIYTEMSDVWSFGVLLWEMFSYGIQPYYGRTNPEVIEMIRDRKLLTCPMNCPKRIYALMCSCWEELSEQRPTFTDLMKRFRQFEEKSGTLSSTTSSSLVDVPPVVNHGDIQTPKYRTFISPLPPSSFVRNDTFSTSGRTAPQSVIADKEGIRFEV